MENNMTNDKNRREELIDELTKTAAAYQLKLFMISESITKLEQSLKKIGFTIPFKYQVPGMIGDGTTYLSWENDKERAKMSRLYLITEGGVEGSSKRVLSETKLEIREHYLQFFDEFIEKFTEEIKTKL